MFSGNGRRGAIAALATAGAALALGAGVLGAGVLNATGGRAAAAVTGASAPAPVQAVEAPGQAPVQVTEQAPVKAPAEATVPWQAIGTGWVLDTYSTGTRTKPAPTTLYLVSPAGAKYPLYTWKVSATPVPTLLAWAGSKTAALLQVYSATGLPAGYGELNLRTGKLTRVAVKAGTTALGYTLPTGQQLLGGTVSGPDATVSRYTKAGALVKNLVTENDGFDGGQPLAASYAPDGIDLGVAAPNGLLLVSNAGGVLRKLPVPGVNARLGCTPVRWWNAATLLAVCNPPSSFAQQLWLVPVSGARPTALTPVRNPAKPPSDNGDIDGWQLTSGLYLQSLGACGTLEINKQAANGSITRVTVPGMTDSPVVVTASGTQLLVEQQGCDGVGGQLAWYNPGTRAEKWLFTAGAGYAVAYNSPENGTIR
jgi:TolB protein